MKPIPILVLLLTLLASLNSHAATNVVTRNRLIDGDTYEFTIDGIDAENMPQWNDKSECPPLMPGTAANLAQNFMTNIVTKYTASWRLSSITLHMISVHPEKWLYKVRFIGDPRTEMGFYNGSVDSFEVIVFFNGVIPSPIKNEYICSQQSVAGYPPQGVGSPEP